MELFIVKHKGKPVKGSGCPHKSAAKLMRDALGGVESGYTVGYGKDHDRKSGNSQGRICRRRKIGR